MEATPTVKPELQPGRGFELSDDFLDRFRQKLQAAWDDLDPEGIASVCTEDVSWADAGLPGPAQGREAVADFVRASAKAFPDFRVEETGSPLLMTEQLRVLVPYRMSGTMLGEWEPLGFAADQPLLQRRGNRPVDLPRRPDLRLRHLLRQPRHEPAARLRAAGRELPPPGDGADAAPAGDLPAAAPSA